MATDQARVRYSIVIPVFDEEAVLHMLLRRLDLLRDPRYRYIGLSRNFGHQVAITAGMEAAQGAAIVVMDADLQDPPEVVEQMIAKWQEGYDVVYARRLSRAGGSRFKRATAQAFYKLLGRI